MSYPQEIYLTKESVLVNIISYETWYSDNYSGKYEYGYPSVTQSDGTDAAGFSFKLEIIQESNKISAYSEACIEGEDEAKRQLHNTRIKDNIFFSDNFNGEFVELKCKTKKGKIIFTKGLLVKDGEYFNFYQLLNKYEEDIKIN
jgi:hypothetical protein